MNDFSFSIIYIGALGWECVGTGKHIRIYSAVGETPLEAMAAVYLEIKQNIELAKC